MKNLETERKFLVDKTKWLLQQKPEGTVYAQGYLVTDEKKAVRVRVAGNEGYLTIKGRSETISRPEYEYAIPGSEALDLLRLFAGPVVEKTRTRIPAGKHVWEVDEFHGSNEGLLLAEIELEDPEETFEKPGWLGEEVTGDPRYYNTFLSENPYGTWK
jgi:CYTH domain-containing protein